MTTLTTPSLERRFLKAVEEEMKADPVRKWTERDFQLCLLLFRQMREGTADIRRSLEGALAKGFEARSFVREYRPLLDEADDFIARIQKLHEQASQAEDEASKKLAAELHLLEQENRAYRDLLDEALTLASEAPRPVDWEHVREAEEAYASGKTKPFSPG